MILIISLLTMMFFIKFIVDTLNYNHSIQGVPKNVEHIYDQQAYQKWLAYYRKQRKFSIVTHTFDFVLLMILLLTHSFGFLESLVGNWTNDIYIQTLVFLGIYYIVSVVIDLPFSYYNTFVIEESFGFNQTTKKTFFLDQIKQILLVVILFGALLFGIQALYVNFGQDIWVFVLTAWLSLSVVMLVIFMLNTKIFVKIFNKLTPLEDGPLKNKIDQLASGLGFEIENISVMDASKRSTKLNAFFSGFGKRRDIVLFDTLVEKMEDEQILAVLGHELSHALHKDTIKMLFQQIIMFLIFASFIGIILSSDSLYTDFGLSGIHFGFALILFSVIVEPISMILGVFTNYMSRIAEYRADRFGAKQVSKKAMISALEVLAKENFSNLNPHPLFETLYYNHPSISKRIASINQS